LTWLAPLAGRHWRSNLEEDELEILGDEIAIKGWELVTIRVEKKIV
jgi:hypothetical protein